MSKREPRPYKIYHGDWPNWKNWRRGEPPYFREGEFVRIEQEVISALPHQPALIYEIVNVDIESHELKTIWSKREEEWRYTIVPEGSQMGERRNHWESELEFYKDRQPPAYPSSSSGSLSKAATSETDDSRQKYTYEDTRRDESGEQPPSYEESQGYTSRQSGGGKTGRR